MRALCRFVTVAALVGACRIPDKVPSAVDAAEVDAALADAAVEDAPVSDGPVVVDAAVSIDTMPIDAAGTCALGDTYCMPVCVDLDTSEAHCGGCNLPCATDQACSAGTCRAPVVYAVRPAMARVGDALTLEGVFGPTATVTFSGAVTVPLQVLGTDRATVTVPAGATTGDAVVATLGQVVPAGRIRIATFGLGLQPFERIFDQAAFAQTTPSLGTARSGAATVRTERWLYVIGGVDGNGDILATIERARINADGSLGPFRTAGSLGTPRAHAAVVTIGAQVYVLGGQTSAPLATIERATIGAGGDLSTFSDASVVLATARSNFAVAVVGRWLYAVGGGATIERAPILADGSLGPFALVASALSRPRLSPAVAVAGSHLYVAGGSDGAALSTIERAAIDGEGDVGTFTVLPVMLTQGRAGAAILVHGGNLYVLGGGETAPLATIERSALLADGTLTTFTASTATYAAARMNAGTVVVGNWLYAIGGAGAGGTATATIERAALASSITLGAFTAVTASGSSAKARGVMVVANGLLNIAGNRGPNPNTIERAPMSASGVLGDFVTVAGASFSPGRNDPAAAVIGDYVYAFGGTFDPGTCCDVTRNVVRASIDAAGGLGSFVNTGTDLTTARNGAAMVIIPPYLYAIGGDNGSGDLSSIERSVINADGTLAGFVGIPGGLVEARSLSAAVVLGDNLYVIGGSSASGYRGIERAAILAGGTLGPFSKLTVNLPQIARGRPGVVVGGNRLFLVGGSGPSGAVSTVEASTIGVDGSLGPFTMVAGVAAPNGAGAGCALIENFLYVVGPTNRSVLAP